MESLYIVMPAYNEESNIEAVVEAWYPKSEGKSEKSRLVIADSGSTDGTHQILEKLKKEKFPKLEILSDTNRYHGPKVAALYEHAIKNEVDYIFQTDSDGQTCPDEFDAFWELRGEYDGIFGNRTSRGDGKIRALVERILCILVYIFFGVRIPDANAPFRLMRTDVVKKYINRLPNEYNLPNVMMTIYYSYYKESMTFREISFKPRQGGVNSINLLSITRIGLQTLKDFRRFSVALRSNSRT